MNRGAIGFGPLNFPVLHLQISPHAYLFLLPHCQRRKWPTSSPRETCCIIHSLPLVSVSSSLNPQLSLQMSSHPKTPHFLFHLPLQLISFLLPSLLLFLYFLRSSQFTAIWLLTPPLYSTFSQKSHQSLLIIKWNGPFSPQPDFCTAFELTDHPS